MLLFCLFLWQKRAFSYALLKLALSSTKIATFLLKSGENGHK
jgi:hypothetical protein